MPFAPSMPKRLLVRYILDWILLLVTIAVAGSLSFIKPNHRPFNPYDPSISFPHAFHETIPTSALICLAIILPGFVILLLCLLAPATSSAFSRESRETLWKRKIVNLNRAWLALGMSIALAMFITDGLKNIIGKPRPDLVSRCEPDWAEVGKIANSTHGGLFQVWDVLITSNLCTAENKKRLNDGFRSFPSGHSSMAFAGLGTLAIFLYSSLVLTTSQSSPFLPTTASAHRHLDDEIARGTAQASPSSSSIPSPSHGRKPSSPAAAATTTTTTTSLWPPQSLPVLFFIVLSSPLFLAAYIASTRFSDYRHHGFDILFGSIEGMFVAVVSSWWYALPSAAGIGRRSNRRGYSSPNMGGLVDGLRMRNGGGSGGGGSGSGGDREGGHVENYRTESHPLVTQGGPSLTATRESRESRGDGHDIV